MKNTIVAAFATMLITGTLPLWAKETQEGATQKSVGQTWYVDASIGSDENDGTTGDSAFATIQRAIDASSAGDEIEVNDGVYDPIKTRNKRIAIRSRNGAAKTAIDASRTWANGVTNRCADLAGMVFHGTNTVLKGFSLANGVALPIFAGTGESYAGEGGGAKGGTLDACLLVWNVAQDGGGAAQSTLLNCEIRENQGNSGGGASSCRLNGCIIRDNIASYGGGSSSSSASGCSYFSNTAFMTVVNGVGQGGYGGGGYSGTYTNCVIYGNHADDYGGGAIYGTLVRCVVENNDAGWHGGGTSDGMLVGCLVKGNTTVLYGGGAYRGHLMNCTVVDNTQTSRGAIGGGAYDAYVGNCIVWGNTGFSGSDDISIDGFMSYARVEYSCSGESHPGTGNTTANPRFRDADSGDYRLTATSPCIDAGNTRLVNQGDLDLDGASRVANLVVDMGAYETEATGAVGVLPTLEDDDGAVVTGNATAGYVIRPGEGQTDVFVSIPQGVDAASVVVEVPTAVQIVKPNGAKIRVSSHGCDITQWLAMPEADSLGAVPVANAQVRAEVADEALDVSKDASITLDPENPALKTAPTKPGLTYTLMEGRSPDAMSAGDSKVGDGSPFEPNITIRGGVSAFYSINVDK